MVFNYFYFIADDDCFVGARPGSPHPFFSLISSASSSPDVLSNCIGGFATGVASAHRRCLSTLVLHSPALARVEDEVGEPSRDRNYAGYPANQPPRRGSSDVGSLFGRVGGVAADILDTFGSFAFMSRATNKTHGIGIFAFEVANAVVRGANLMESLSEKNIRHLKDVVLPSKGVQCLVSGDMDELLKVAALDKREELKVFMGEVVRFGNLCKDTQWHNLDRYFDKSLSQPQKKQSEVKEYMLMQQLMCMTQYTAELYYKFHEIDRLEQHYLHKVDDYDSSNASDRDKDSLSLLRADLRAQRKLAKSLKKKSLWSRNLEEVVEKLVDITIFLCFKIDKVFNVAECDLAHGNLTNRRTLGSACLDLHYATVITHINALMAAFRNCGETIKATGLAFFLARPVSQPNSIPPSTRDALYQGLPGHVRSALRQQLCKFRVQEDLPISEIEEAMEEKLQWLLPMAAKTIKVHHSFHWTGEWANLMTNSNRESAEAMRIETLHHADIKSTNQHILELLLWLHHLVAHSSAHNVRDGSSAQHLVLSSPSMPPAKPEIVMLNKVMKQTLATSGSLKLGDAKAQVSKRTHRLATSSSDPPTSEARNTFPGEGLYFPVINSDSDWLKVLDIIDGVESI